MQYFTQETIDFLWKLRLNNNKTWFTENKHLFNTHVNTPLKALAQDVFATIEGDNLTYKVARIYKDARRVKGGDPYRDNIWFFIEKHTYNDDYSTVPGFWFEISPEGISYGLGYYQAKALTMAKFRARLDKNPKAFLKLVKDSGFEKNGLIIQGDEYKRKKPAPKNLEDWYNKKLFSIAYNSSSHGELYKDELKERLSSTYSSLMPLYNYFASLDSDPDPRSDL